MAGGAVAGGNRPNAGNGNFSNGNINNRAVNNDSFTNRNFNNNNVTNRNLNNDNFTNRNFNNNDITNRNFNNNNFNNNNFANRNFNNFSNNNINVNRGGQYGAWYHGNWQANAGWNGGGYRPWGWGWGGSGFGWGLGAGLVTAGRRGRGLALELGLLRLFESLLERRRQHVHQLLAADRRRGPARSRADRSWPMTGGPVPAPGRHCRCRRRAGCRRPTRIRRWRSSRGRVGSSRPAIMPAHWPRPTTPSSCQPNDPVLHEFRALCLFAQGDYQQSAAATYAVLSGGPGWDWTTVSSLYPSITVYTQQLRALEKYSQEHPDAADARFLLAYQYLLTGHNDAASAELKQVVALQPNDALSAQLLKSISPAADDAYAARRGPTPAPATKPADAAALVGNWTASRPDGTKVEMDLTAANQFTWRFDQGGKPQELKGTYTLADNYLVLKAGEQNSLVGQVGLLANNEMSFRLADNNPADPGLVFKS